MVSRRSMKLLLSAALMLLGMVATAAAQSAAVVVGSIVDQTGASLPGVRVTIRGVAVRTADSRTAGDFVFPDLPEGDYEISAELSGFGRRTRRVHDASGSDNRDPRPCHPIFRGRPPTARAHRRRCEPINPFERTFTRGTSGRWPGTEPAESQGTSFNSSRLRTTTRRVPSTRRDTASRNHEPPSSRGERDGIR